MTKVYGIPTNLSVNLNTKMHDRKVHKHLCIVKRMQHDELVI